MDLNEVVRRLGLADGTESLESGWERSQQSMPEGGIPLLSREAVDSAFRDLGLSPEVLDAAQAVRERVAADDALSALAWHCHSALYAGDHYSFDDVCKWPKVTALGDDSRMFYLIALASGMPRLRAINTAHSVPAEVEHETLGDVLRSVDRRHRHDGSRAWGMSTNEVAWFANFIRGDLYRLGRLQFQFGRFWHSFRAFRHRASRVVLAFAEPGLHFRPNGQLASCPDESGAWTSELAIADGLIVGNPVLPTGEALRRTVSLPADEWDQVLGHEAPTLNVHMPGGRPLAHDECGESFRRAVEFFPRHFPERPFVGFCCESWLLDSQLEGLLPASSNMVRFQRDVYLLPMDMGTDELFRTVFHGKPDDLSKAPRDTGLQRALADRLERGEPVEQKAGGCFLLPEDLDWGAEVYRRQPLEQFLGPV